MPDTHPTTCLEAFWANCRRPSGTARHDLGNLSPAKLLDQTVDFLHRSYRPRAMRFFRLPLISAWSRRSRAVMESIMAATCFISFSGKPLFARSFSFWPPGACPGSLERAQPIHLPELRPEVFQRERAADQFLLRSFGFFPRKRFLGLRSTRTSPMPRIRDAIRSG